MDPMFRQTEPAQTLEEATARVVQQLRYAIGYLNESTMIHNSRCHEPGGSPYPNGAEEALADYDRLRQNHENRFNPRRHYVFARLRHPRLRPQWAQAIRDLRQRTEHHLRWAGHLLP